MNDTLQHHGEMNRQILELVNEHSPIISKLRIADVSNALYAHIEIVDVVVACMRITRANWYQAEFTHLVVRPEYRRQGYGRAVIQQGCEKARELGLKLAQCTIRSGNVESMCLFAREGFKATNHIIGLSGAEISVWQRVL